MKATKLNLNDMTGDEARDASIEANFDYAQKRIKHYSSRGLQKLCVHLYYENVVRLLGLGYNMECSYLTTHYIVDEKMMSTNEITSENINDIHQTCKSRIIINLIKSTQ